ncbi:single-pass membrane and coiled-coil domain-containing protein 3-like [Triplophysa rosa]|uniref:single-pass membrane and coiled-coil domain-containing protein 3-like n=1 Tax=Triplophysa rosa TaxID=992332 RepID=UPI0025462120|nr:single-pass membrane and coiled-coil domain-containing protein 3-like [Triplophysa rosa]
MLSWILGKNDKEKKEELIRSTQSLHHYVHKYFSITNRLLEILNTHMERNICPAVSANENESIEQNCARMREVMCQIVDVCEREEKHCKSIAPDLYEKIAFSMVSLKDKVTVIKELHENTMGIMGNVLCPLVTIQLARSDLKKVMPPIEELKSQSDSSFVLGDLVQSSKNITKLLCKAENQEKTLDEAVQLVQDLLSILKPPCDSYSDVLSEVQANVNIISENI